MSAPDRVPSGTPPTPTQKRDAIREVLVSHAIECTGRGEVSCRCHNPSGWMDWPDYFDHVADAIAAALRSPDPVRPPEPDAVNVSETSATLVELFGADAIREWSDEMVGAAAITLVRIEARQTAPTPTESPQTAVLSPSAPASGQGEPTSREEMRALIEEIATGQHGRTLVDSIAYALCAQDESGDGDCGIDNQSEWIAKQLIADGWVTS